MGTFVLNLSSANAPEQYYLHHDLESCFWAFVWHAAYHGNEKKQSWADKNLFASRGAKIGFLFDSDVRNFGSREVFKQEIENLCCMLLLENMAAQKRERVACTGASGLEAMGGDFTYELFMAKIESMVERVQN